MRILQMNSHDCGGGAESVALQLHREYLKAGHDAWLAVGNRRSNDDRVVTIPNDALRNPWARFWNGVAQPYIQKAEREDRFPTAGRLLELAVGQPARFASRLMGREDFAFPGSHELLSLIPGRPDILHAHNLHGRYFDLRVLPELSGQIPTLLTLHDAWLLSGHCAHSFACDRWLTGCGKCPDLTIPPEIWRDGTAHNFRVKQAIYKTSRLFITAPSQWLMDKAQRSMLATAIMGSRVIPNGIDLEVFHRGDRRAARAAIGLPDDARVVLFCGTRPRHNAFKDFATLVTAMRRVAAGSPAARYILVALGGAGPQEEFGNLEIRYVPFQRESPMVAKFYHASNLYVHAAKAEAAAPLTVLEALACGVPVVASNICGMSERVTAGREALLVPPGDAEAMGGAITQVLDDPALGVRLGDAGAALAQQQFSHQRMASAYLDWYAEILERWHAGTAARENRK